MTEVWGDLNDWKQNVLELIRKACSMQKDAIIRIFVAAVVSDYSLVWNWEKKAMSIMHKRDFPVQTWLFTGEDGKKLKPDQSPNINTNSSAINFFFIYSTLKELLRLVIGPLNLVWMSLGITEKDWVAKHMPMLESDDLWKKRFELHLDMQTSYMTPKFEWLPNARFPGTGRLTFHRGFGKGSTGQTYTVSGPNMKQLMLGWMFDRLSMFFDDPSMIDLKIVDPTLTPAPVAGNGPKADADGSDTDTASSTFSTSATSDRV